MNHTSLSASSSISLLGCQSTDTILQRFQEGSVFLRQLWYFSLFQCYARPGRLWCSNNYRAGMKPGLPRSLCNYPSCGLLIAMQASQLANTMDIFSLAYALNC
jgi:hypothetical protein